MAVSNGFIFANAVYRKNSFQIDRAGSQAAIAFANSSRFGTTLRWKCEMLVVQEKYISFRVANVIVVLRFRSQHLGSRST